MGISKRESRDLVGLIGAFKSDSSRAWRVDPSVGTRICMIGFACDPRETVSGVSCSVESDTLLMRKSLWSLVICLEIECV